MVHLLINQLIFGAAHCTFKLCGLYHRIGWWENLPETPMFDVKNKDFLLIFPLANPLIVWTSTFPGCVWKDGGSLSCHENHSDPKTWVLVKGPQFHIQTGSLWWLNAGFMGRIVGYYIGIWKYIYTYIHKYIYIYI